MKNAYSILALFLVLSLVSCIGLDRGAAPGTFTAAATGEAIPSTATLPPTEPEGQDQSSETASALPATTTNPPISSTAEATASLILSSPTPITPSSIGPDGFPDPAKTSWAPVVAGLENPIGIEVPGDGTRRIFILEQPGRIRISRDGLLQPQPFLDISDRIGSTGFEQGLLGLAFHPDYAQNGFFYVNYTDLNGDTVIARFQVSSQDPNIADPASELRLLWVDQPYANHNGGEVAFGPDGYLYLGLGDGGSAGDPQNNAQSLDSLLGKILRLDVDSADPYGIPANNPYAGGGGRAEIFAYGLRNPWRFAFDPHTGDLLIGDVGQNAWEEIDYLSSDQIEQITPGLAFNFGWSYKEGNHDYNGQPSAGLSLIPPIAEYGHESGCSVTGGVVYRGSELPDWQGVYIYGDYCTGIIWGLKKMADGTWGQKLLFENLGRITTFGQDEAGEVYLADQNGIIYKLANR